MVDGGEALAQRVIPGAALDADRALPRRRQHFLRRDGSGLLRHAEPRESGHRQEGGVELPGPHALQPRFDIAADERRCEVGPPGQHLRLAAQRGRADTRARRQAGECARPARQAVAGVFARQHRGQHEAFGQHRLQVLHGVDRGVDPPVGQRRLDLLREQALATDIGQPPVAYPVPGRADGDDLDIEARILRPQGGGRLFRLPEGERAAARAETKSCHARRVTPSGGRAQSVAAPADGRNPSPRPPTGAIRHCAGRRGLYRPAAMRVLGIETSCDETAAAVVDANRRILAERLFSQTREHAPYGGVVPEIAARAHLDRLDALVAETMAEAGLGFAGLDGIAAAAGPGLIGGLLVGATAAKAMALASGRPFLAVNHLEAHALTARLTDGLDFPYLLLLVSGGHTQLLAVEGVGRYRLYGETEDDALGEAFDKAARLLGLGFPGGPAVEKAAEAGDPARFRLPRPLAGRPGAGFSFSGLKTALRRAAEALPALNERDVADLAASFQAAAADTLADRTANAAALFRQDCPAGRVLVAAGGVAANRSLRARLQEVAAAHGLAFAAPPPRLCTDNAAMVAWAGLERLRLGARDGLDFRPRPRWPLASTNGAP